MASSPGNMTDVDVAGRYPWPTDRPWVRVMNATTLDGSVAGGDGRSRSISSPADRAAMAEVRRLCDAILIGGATLRAERYRPVVAIDPAGRSASGLGAAPVLVVVTGTCDLPWEEPVFTDSQMRPLIVTSLGADDAHLTRARQNCDVLALPGSTLRMRAVVDALRARGLMRIACEAGPRLVAQMIDEGVVDELDITFSPVFAGQTSPGSPLTEPARWTLHEHWVVDGFLFTRYVREGTLA